MMKASRLQDLDGSRQKNRRCHQTQKTDSYRCERNQLLDDGGNPIEGDGYTQAHIKRAATGEGLRPLEDAHDADVGHDKGGPCLIDD